MRMIVATALVLVVLQFIICYRICFLNGYTEENFSARKKKIYSLCFPTAPRQRFKESLCILTECGKCGRKFLSSIEKAPDKLPTRCSGCGNNLVWSVPYTRIEVETEDGIVLEGRNLIHKNGWVEDMQEYVLRYLNDEGIERVKVLIRKRKGGDD